MAAGDIVEAYTETSYKRQIRLLRKELSSLGVDITSEDAARISFLSRRKYDRYDHFYPGETFDSRLLKWLGLNFEKNERKVAVEIVKSLKFISAYEMKELAIKTFENIKYIIMNELVDLSTNNWYNYIESRNLKLERELAKSVFVACADDISFSFFRRYAMRHNTFFKKDNFVEYYKRDKKSLDELPTHNRIFLLDQLSGSGTTVVRQENSEWKGKIPTFLGIWREYINDSSIYYCPYILSTVAERNLTSRLTLFMNENEGLRVSNYPTCKMQISPCLINEQGTDVDENRPVAKLCIKHYHKFEEDKHIKKGGSACFGYGRAGLTLVLQSNCPNNSLYVLWYSSDNWYPLFPRISHHREV